MAQKTILSDTPERLIRKYQKALMKAGVPVTSLILFGSYAKGTAKPWSDVDVCVVSPEFGHNRFDERGQLMNISYPIDYMLEPHPFSPEGLTDKYDPLAAEIRRYGKVIV